MVLQDLQVKETGPDDFERAKSFWFRQKTLYELGERKGIILAPLCQDSYHGFFEMMLEEPLLYRVSYNEQGPWKRVPPSALNAKKIDDIVEIAQHDRYKKGHLEFKFAPEGEGTHVPFKEMLRRIAKIRVAEVYGKLCSFEVFAPPFFQELISIRGGDGDANLDGNLSALWVPEHEQGDYYRPSVYARQQASSLAENGHFPEGRLAHLLTAFRSRGRFLE